MVPSGKASSQTGQAVQALQVMLPRARVIYSSATGLLPCRTVSLSFSRVTYYVWGQQWGKSIALNPSPSCAPPLRVMNHSGGTRLCV